MRSFLLIFTVGLVGCRSVPDGIVVTGSAYVESERPDGRAVAKVEVHYRPPAAPPRSVTVAAQAPTPVLAFAEFSESSKEIR